MARSTTTANEASTASTPSQPSGASVAEKSNEGIEIPPTEPAPTENHGKNSRSIASSSARPPTIQSSRLTLSRFTGTPPEEHGGQASDSMRVVPLLPAAALPSLGT